MRYFVVLAFPASCCLMLAACLENPEIEGGSGGGGTNPDGWGSLRGGGGGDGDSDADADGDADGDAGTADAGTVEACTLTGNEGLNVGDLAPDLTLYQCDGTAVQAHQLFCDSPYTFLFSYAEW